MKTISLTEEMIDKILTHCEEMIELCDTPEERQVYQDMIVELTK